MKQKKAKDMTEAEKGLLIKEIEKTKFIERTVLAHDFEGSLRGGLKKGLKGFKI